MFSFLANYINRARRRRRDNEKLLEVHSFSFPFKSFRHSGQTAASTLAPAWFEGFKLIKKGEERAEKFIVSIKDGSICVNVEQ